jgi:hypothetical protein
LFALDVEAPFVEWASNIFFSMPAACKTYFNHLAIVHGFMALWGFT